MNPHSCEADETEVTEACEMTEQCIAQEEELRSVCSTDAPVTAPKAAGPPTAPAPEVSRRAAIEMPTRLEKLTALQAPSEARPRPQVMQPLPNWTPSPQVPPAGPSAASRPPSQCSPVRPFHGHVTLAKP
mmetsp:Transcript_52192/g.93110  ORF Transcript_52192/g.93110 Transcript_52192/m.93110 type:complete len:130 (-) Transcript_52192:276-665(-)